MKEVIIMKCPFCGKEIPDDSKFCPACGQPIPRDLDYSKEQHIDQNYSDPAHEVTYSGAFSQKVSGPNQTSRINMQGGAGTAQGPYDPKKARTELIVALSITIILAVVGLILGIQALKPENKNETMLVPFSIACSFFGLFGILIFWLPMQTRLWKNKKPEEFVDWVPLGMAVILLGLVIPAIIFAVQGFILLIS